ncbi:MULTISPECIES: hypothetical protein [Pseudomonas]|uniref:hypothetical protein n=1 Tax=Pseudomonas TaxID=286 RepID=UPI0006B43B9D|nr:hypothetical protein [Pseudomonas fuscovaginae]KPA95901.1 hypothetical protein PF70_04079 [Pseudomonas fuscovaginae]
MKTKTTMYQVLLATGTCEGLATAILEELKIEKDQVLPFEPGRLLVTQGVQTLERVGALDALPYLIRHLIGDWGDLYASERIANCEALLSGKRLRSFYRLDEDEQYHLQIFTAADRRFTLLQLS